MILFQMEKKVQIFENRYNFVGTSMHFHVISAQKKNIFELFAEKNFIIFPKCIAPPKYKAP